MNWNRRTAMWAGLALVVLTNGVALGGAAYNRMGLPEGTLKLSERELSPPYAWNRMTENSGLSLQLRWRSLPAMAPRKSGARVSMGGRNPGWLDATKMRELGFEAKPNAEALDRFSRAHEQLPREVFIALELEGPAYQEALRRADVPAADGAFADPQDHERLASRLFAVDAGLDRSALRARYPDRTMYAIVRGRIRPLRYRDEGEAAGYIDALSVDAVNVPLQMRPVFEGVEPQNSVPAGKPGARFDATVVFGARSEPWLAAAARH